MSAVPLLLTMRGPCLRPLLSPGLWAEQRPLEVRLGIAALCRLQLPAGSRCHPRHRESHTCLCGGVPECVKVCVDLGVCAWCGCVESGLHRVNAAVPEMVSPSQDRSGAGGNGLGQKYHSPAHQLSSSPRAHSDIQGSVHMATTHITREFSASLLNSAESDFPKQGGRPLKSKTCSVSHTTTLSRERSWEAAPLTTFSPKSICKHMPGL